MSTPRQFNVGAFLAEAPGLRAVTVLATSTAAANGNGLAQNGITIDRRALTRRYLSAKAQVLVSAVRESTGLETITVALKAQDSADGTSWTDYSTDTEPAALVLGATSTAAGGTNLSSGPNGTQAQSVNLLRARQFIRMVATPTHGATSSGADQVTVAGIWTFGGADFNPAS